MDRRTLQWTGGFVVVAVVLAAGWFGVRALRRSGTTAATREQLSVLRADPILDVEAPGTELASRSERAGGERFGVVDSTEISLMFDVEGDLTDAMDVYRTAAPAAGWRLVRTRCSRIDRGVVVSFDKVQPGFLASLDLMFNAAEPPPQGRRLSVALTAQDPRSPRTAPEAGAEGTPRGDPTCLRGLNPSDPALQRPLRVPGNAAALCSLVSVARARTVVPALTQAIHLSDPPGCSYIDDDRASFVGFVLENAVEPRAEYEDRQYAPTVDQRFFLLEESTSRPAGAWVDTRLGPVELTVITEGGSQPPLSEDQVLRLAELIAGPAQR